MLYFLVFVILWSFKGVNAQAVAPNLCYNPINLPASFGQAIQGNYPQGSFGQSIQIPYNGPPANYAPPGTFPSYPPIVTATGQPQNGPQYQVYGQQNMGQVQQQYRPTGQNFAGSTYQPQGGQYQYTFNPNAGGTTPSGRYQGGTTPSGGYQGPYGTSTPMPPYGSSTIPSYVGSTPGPYGQGSTPYNQGFTRITPSTGPYTFSPLGGQQGPQSIQDGYQGPQGGAQQRYFPTQPQYEGQMGSSSTPSPFASSQNLQNFYGQGQQGPYGQGIYPGTSEGAYQGPITTPAPYSPYGSSNQKSYNPNQPYGGQQATQGPYAPTGQPYEGTYENRTSTPSSYEGVQPTQAPYPSQNQPSYEGTQGYPPYGSPQTGQASYGGSQSSPTPYGTPSTSPYGGPPSTSSPYPSQSSSPYANPTQTQAPYPPQNQPQYQPYSGNQPPSGPASGRWSFEPYQREPYLYKGQQLSTEFPYVADLYKKK